MQVLSSQMDLVITTCLFLASKLEEDQRRLRDVINVTHRLTSTHQPRTSLKRSREELERSPNSTDDSKDQPLNLDHEYWALKERVVQMEQRILRGLGFDLELIHPFRLVLHLANALECSQRVVQRAWALANDALWSSACLSLAPNSLAAATIYVASRLEGESHCLPPRRSESNGDESKIVTEAVWWESFGVVDDVMTEACRAVIDAAVTAGKTGRRPGSKLHSTQSCSNGNSV